MTRPAVPAPAAIPLVPLPAVAPPLLLGFQDDGSFRWSSTRQQLLDQAAAAGATLIRTTVNWSQIAPRRPARPRDSFDPAYRFDDLDELIRNAQQRGIQVLLTIWGTPSWANGGAGHNHAPARAADLGAFAQAVADRYSGRHAGYPFVGYYTVWNEPNLEQFLAPQYDSAGDAAAPAAYARLYRAAYAGIKAGNPSALVAIGETSPRGRDLPTQSRVQQSESPGRFAQLLSRERPRLRFDAWAHHPYPTAPNLPPTQRARWPNVTLAELPRFEAALRSWFGRANVPIWITEYAYQTNPPYRLGVPPARQAAYLRESLAMVAREPWVRMVIWFTFRDSAGNPWKSGLTAADGTRKPSFAAFVAAGRALAARNATVAGSIHSSIQSIPLPAQPISYYSGAGAAVGLTYRVLLDGAQVAGGQAAADLRRDGTVVLRLPFRPRSGERYTVHVTYSDVHGNRLAETRTLVASG